MIYKPATMARREPQGRIALMADGHYGSNGPNQIGNQGTSPGASVVVTTPQGNVQGTVGHAGQVFTPGGTLWKS
jgi:hypothetical protein